MNRALSILAPLCILAACSEESSPPAPTPAAATSMSCDALDTAILAAALGVATLDLDRSRSSSRVMQCRFVDPAAGGESVVIQITRGMSHESFEEARDVSFGDRTRPVTDLGDSAYEVDAAGQYTLVALAGRRAVQVSGSFEAARMRALAEALVALP